MILMNKKDLSLYKTVMMIKENDLHPYLVKMLEKKYKYHNVIDTPDFVIAEGNLPIYLLAHLDVVATSAPSNIIYDREQNIMSCLNGFGADDRNGVWTILKLLDKGYRPHIIFTHGEEVGGIGAESVIKIFPKMPYDAKYLVQLDRRGDDDCVFYDCDNPDFTR